MAAFGGKVAQGPTEVKMRVGKKRLRCGRVPRMTNSSKIQVNFLSQLTGQPNSLLMNTVIH